MKKKNEFLVIFMIFQFLEMNEKKKKNHFIMKNKKKKFMVQKLRATAHLSRQVELGAGWAHWARSRR